MQKNHESSSKSLFIIFSLCLIGAVACTKKKVAEDSSSESLATKTLQVSIQDGATAGDRFVIASVGSSYQVGLVGISVAESEVSPSGYSNKYPHFQVIEGATYTTDNPYYWLPNEVESPSKVKSKKIQVKISDTIWDESSQSLVATPAWLIQKVENSFLIWESIPETTFYFEMAGTYDATATRPTGTVGAPLITLDFTKEGETEFPGGIGGHATFNEAPDNSAIPSSYSGGHVAINMTQYYSNDFQTNLYYHNTLYRILVHEVGHALGLYHSATNSSVMTCGTSAIGDTNDFLFLSEQDKADMTYQWNPSNANSYSISGTVEFGSHVGAMMVYAVDVITGKTYSTLATSESYTIAIRSPGTYVVVAKNDDHTASYTNVFRPTWYQENQSAGTLVPSEATEITVNSSNKHVTGIDVAPQSGAGLFNLFLAFLPTLGTADPGQALLQPDQAMNLIFYLHNPTVDVSGVQFSSFGSAPDYVISEP
ncbi:MAG: matrixin family metalloprotease [Pseudobdellovibrionaceae bacterium]